jgi:hypothetical protein
VAKVTTDDKANSRGKSKPQPYAPSWIDRLTAWVERLPGPSWSYYLRPLSCGVKEPIRSVPSPLCICFSRW